MIIMIIFHGIWEIPQVTLQIHSDKIKLPIILNAIERAPIHESYFQMQMIQWDSDLMEIPVFATLQADL